jgi:hypothetical protein
MLPDTERITWLASYPKSGNTWVRCLIQAYRSNGYLDINDLGTVAGDSPVCHTHAVSATDLRDLGLRGQWLLRPAALLNAAMGKAPPRIFKTHYANVTLDGLPAFIPPELTQRAIYVLRDPRSVALSMSQYYNLSMPKIVEQMNNNDFLIGFDPNITKLVQIPQRITSWSNHVRSWASQTIYPVHVVKYEDMIEDPLQQLKEVIEFLGIDYDEARAKRAVNAAKLSKLRKVENDVGFDEYHLKDERGNFFNEGGTRWSKELGAKYIAQIEKDHKTVMKQLGYL